MYIYKGKRYTANIMSNYSLNFGPVSKRLDVLQMSHIYETGCLGDLKMLVVLPK